jgi:hypothetical protein
MLLSVAEKQSPGIYPGPAVGTFGEGHFDANVQTAVARSGHKIGAE